MQLRGRRRVDGVGASEIRFPHRWARHGIAVDESNEIIVVQLQLCAVARHAAKFPVQQAQIWTGAEHRSGWPDRHVQTWSARCAGASRDTSAGAGRAADAGADAAAGAAAAGVSIRAGNAAAFSRARVLAAAGSMPFLINRL